MIRGHDEQSVLPRGVLLYLLDGSINRLIKVLSLLDIAHWVISVAGPVDGTALNHDGKAILVLSQRIEGASRHGGEIDDVVKRVRVRSLCLARAGVLQRGTYLRDTPILLLRLDVTLRHLLEVIVGLEVIPVGLASGKLGVVVLVHEAIVGSIDLLVVIIVERVASGHDQVEGAAERLTANVLQLIAVLVVRGPRRRSGFGIESV